MGNVEQKGTTVHGTAKAICEGGENQQQQQAMLVRIVVCQGSSCGGKGVRSNSAASATQAPAPGEIESESQKRITQKKLAPARKV